VARDVNLTVRIGALELSTPVIGASGLFGYGDEYEGFLDYSALGALVTKTVTLEPREGNPPPRIAEAESGLLNSIGLENVGLRVFKEHVLPRIEIPCSLIVSVGGASVDEYAALAAGLDGAEGVAGIEVNVSCPNVAEGCAVFGCDPASTRRVIEAVRRKTRLPLAAKLPPVVWGIERVSSAAVEAGAEALVIANTYPAMAIDPFTARPVLGGLTGGLSGRAIKPVSLLMVWKAARALDVPVIGCGGIEDARDAIEYILAGASAFQVGSAILRDPRAPSRILEGLRAYMEEKGCDRLDDMRGRAPGQEEMRGAK
jgi:dihydroorotate dehydrogenase (NAD+) catalytic subunit